MLSRQRLSTRVGERCAEANRPLVFDPRRSQFFLSDIQGHHVLVRSDSRSVVSCINHQGSLVSKRLCTLANDLLLWVQNNLCSLKATNVQARWTMEQTCCQGTGSPQRNGRSTRSWFRKFGKSVAEARVDLFASEDNSHCPIFFTKSMDALAQSSALCFPSNRSSTAGTQASQVAMAQTHSNMLWAALLSRFFRRNLRCSGEAAYIARRPAHFGGLCIARHSQTIGSFFSTARTNGRAVSLRAYKKASVEEETFFFPHTSFFDAVLAPYLREPRLR